MLYIWGRPSSFVSTRTSTQMLAPSLCVNLIISFVNGSEKKWNCRGVAWVYSAEGKINQANVKPILWDLYSGRHRSFSSSLVPVTTERRLLTYWSNFVWTSRAMLIRQLTLPFLPIYPLPDTGTWGLSSFRLQWSWIGSFSFPHLTEVWAIPFGSYKMIYHSYVKFAVTYVLCSWRLYMLIHITCWLHNHHLTPWRV